MKKNSKSNFSKVSILFICFAMLIAAITLIAQTTKKEGGNEISLGKIEGLNLENGNTTNRNLGEIIAIRRVNHLTEDLDAKGFTFEEKVPFVEIEIYLGKNPDTGANSFHIVRIGDRDFVVYEWTESKSAILLMTTDDFSELNDKSVISYRTGEPVEKEKLKQLISSGEMPIVAGTKLGNLNKSLIGQSPEIDRKRGRRQ